jgi:hypothetical protein
MTNTFGSGQQPMGTPNPDAVQESIRKMVKINPDLAKDPTSISAIANRYGLKSDEVASMLATQQHKGAASRGIWGTITSGIGTAWNGITSGVGAVAHDVVHFSPRNAWHAVEGVSNAMSSIQQGLQNPTNWPATARGLFQTVKDVPGQVKGAIQQVQDVQSFFQNPFQTVNKTTGQTAFGKVASDVSNLAMLPQTLAAATASEAKRNGNYFAFGHLVGTVAEAALLKKIPTRLVGEEVTAGEFAQQQATAQLARDQALVDSATGGLDFAKQADVAQAAQRLRASNTTWNLENQIRNLENNSAQNAGATERIAALQEKLRATQEAAAKEAGTTEPSSYATNFNKSTNASIRVARALGKPITIPLEALKAFHRVMGGTLMNIAGLLRMPGIQSDPHLWELARQGKVEDANGKVTTVGDAIATALNQPQGFFHDIMSRVINLDLAFFADDPLVKGMKLVGQAKSAAGFTGTLSRYFGGLGITHPGDFTRAYQQYSSVRRAINYIAAHNAVAINKTFRNMFNGRMLVTLEKASTPQEVLSAFEDSFGAVDFISSTVPTMGWYSGFKTALTGTLGEKFGTLGRLLESDLVIDADIREQIMKQTGYDVAPKNDLYERLAPPGKIKVLMRERLRSQFVRSQQIFDKSTLTFNNRVVVPGSVDAINAIADMMRAIPGTPEMIIDDVSALLIHNAYDPAAYTRAYREAFYKLITRPTEAQMPRAEFEAVNNALSDHIWDMVNKLTGNDGGGYTGNYIATKDGWRNMVDTPMGPKAAGIGDNHLGKLILPNPRQIKRLQRNILAVATELKSYAADQALLDTTTSLEHWVSIANFSDKHIEQILSDLKKGLEEKRISTKELWERENIYKGYGNKFRSMLKQYEIWLQNDAMKGLTRSQKIALVIKNTEDEMVKVKEQFGRLSDDITSRLGIVPPGFEAKAEDLATFAEENGTTADAMLDAMDILRGEREAIEDMTARMHATINTSFDNPKEVLKSAQMVASLTIENAEAKSEYLKKFKEELDLKTESVAGKRAPVKFLAEHTFGKRNLRSNREMVVDLMQGYLNKYFKPLALASIGWALRVSTSEAMLNALRIGGNNFFDAHLAASIAKHEFKLGNSMEKLAEEGRAEKMMLRNVVGGLMLGLEREVLSIANPQRARLVNDAVDLMHRHDGHYPMSMHSNTDTVAGDSIENSVMGAVHSVDKDGNPKISRMYRGENHTIIGNNDAGAGTALHENLSMVFNDAILSVGAKYLYAESKGAGIASFALNSEAMTQRVVKESVKRIETGPGKEVWKARNQFVSDLRAEVENMSEFKALNEEERNQIIQAVNDTAKTVESLTDEQFPKYLRGTYDAQNRAIANTENAIKRIEQQIEVQERIVKEYEEAWRVGAINDATPEERLTIGEKLDEADARLRTLGSARTLLDREIENHPFRRFYTTIESGAALNPYKPALNDLRQKLTDKVSKSQQETEARLRELLGDKPLALPQGGFADLSTERMLTFKDAGGNPVPNEEMYRQVFESHPELWSDNEAYNKWLPVGMPGVHGRDFLDALGGRAEIAEVQRLIKHEQQLSALHDALRASKFKEAYAILHDLDPLSISATRPVLTEGSADLSRATEAFSVDGVSPELILGHGRTQEKTLADLALLDRQNKSLDVPNMFSKSFFPNYAPTEAGKATFTADFEKHLNALTSKKATETEKATAAKWFFKIVDPDPEKWATTANKVWKQNLESYLINKTKVKDREDYYALLEQRKQLSADRSKIGVEKRQILKQTGLADSADDLTDVAEKRYIEAANHLDALQGQRAMNDAKLAKAHMKRDELEQHVIAQDAKMREKFAKDANKMYEARIRKGQKGMSTIMRRIEARTATINKSLEKTAASVIDDVVSGLSAKGLSGAEAHAALRERLTDFMYAHLNSLDSNQLAPFLRSYCPRQFESTGDPMLDWAQDITEHLLTLTTADANKQFFPELAQQMAEGNFWGPQKTAHWLGAGIKARKPMPSNFPAREFIPPLAKGSKSNLLISLSDKLHTKVLAPIVNELVREPVFLWEYHQQMELLRPRIQLGLITKDQAMIQAEINATLNMNKFVHDPLGKTVWENNWRVAAPFYFAKNQAMRRALRMSGDNLAAFYKYLHLNLAVTDFVAQSSLGQNNFVVPGSEVISGLGAGVTGSIMYAFGYKPLTGMDQMNFSFGGSPSSVASIIITGTKPGIMNVAREMVAIPFAPTVTFPAKLVYETLFHYNPLVEQVLTDLLGETAMRSTALDDLMPSSLVRNTIKGVTGFFDQNNASVYTSTELYVMQDMAQQKFNEAYDKVRKEYPSVSQADIKRFGSKEQLWAFYAVREFSQYFNQGANMQSFMNNVNRRTAFLYSMKTILSFASPTAVNIGQNFLKNKEFDAISKEKDQQGNLKFPTYFLQADEFSRRYPKDIFGLIGHTKSTGARWSITDADLKFMENNWGTVQSMPNATAYLVGSSGSPYNSRALQLEYALGVRKRETPQEFMKSLFVTLGNRYYGQLYDGLKSDPSNIDSSTGGLNYKAGMQLRSMSTTYGQTVNPTWLADRNSGRKNNVAYKTYNEIVTMVNDPHYHSTFTSEQLSVYKDLIQLRKGYEDAYNQRILNGEKTGILRSEWYSYCDQLAKNPEWKDYSGFVNDVMKNLPSPQ